MSKTLINRIRTALSVSFPLLIVLCACKIATACPTCKEGLAEDGSNMAQGYMWSILFMMSMPFLILTGLGVYFYLMVRSARAQPVVQPIHVATTRPAAGPVESTSMRRQVKEPVEV